MKLKIHQTKLCRTPKFSYLSELIDCWDELKKAIAVSSDAFYQTIKDISAQELESLPAKTFFTIWKYFNRAKFRSTPYGTFASFVYLEGESLNEENHIVIEAEQELHQFVDWPVKNQIEFSVQELLASDFLLFSNSSCYLAIDSIRYIASTDGHFELAEIEQDALVKNILDACLKPIRIQDLISYLKIEDKGLEDFYALLQDMLSLQLLFSNYSPNIIGQDYFRRIGFEEQDLLPKYIIAERKYIKGSISSQLLTALPDLIKLLQPISAVHEQAALKNFKNKFLNKFEQREIPLMIALDPEMGIGYDELEQADQSDDFVVQFIGKKNKAENKQADELKKIIKAASFVEGFERNQTIFLDKLQLPSSNKADFLPNSFSVTASVVDDFLCIDQIGGVTANALNGRFTMANDRVEQYCKEIASIEQQANPDVLFFDVAYMAETNVDNINRRKLVYEHQLSILNYDTSSEPLVLNDIMLSIQDNEVVLRSIKHNKRVVPKLASAYNYTRSDLSVFRLFCDLQYQNIQANLGISLDGLFPNQTYYPRLQYKNIILSQAKWQIDSKALFLELGKDPMPNQCRAYLIKLGVNGYFKMGLSDQTLCFNVDDDSDLVAFVQYLRKQSTPWLEEVLMPVSSIVEDVSGKPYLAQFILTVFDQHEIYKGFEKQSALASAKVPQFFPPGKEWLYYEIFCHQQRSDYLICNNIQQFLFEHKEKIKSWFFIRYNENGNHLRLRILLNDEKDGQELTAALSDLIENELLLGLVSDFQLRTYKRETERYGNDLIEQIERHFCTDSNFVLSLLNTFTDVNSKYKFCADLAIAIQNAGVFGTEKFKNMIQMMSDAFNHEHHLDVQDFKKLNAQYQLYKTTVYLELNDEQNALFAHFIQSFIAVLMLCEEEERRIRLFGDLLHMHVNRLFNKDQRTHEMVMYYFLLKEIHRRLHTPAR